MSGILTAQFQDPVSSELLGDAAYVRGLLDFEVALAKVQGRLGVIPASAAQVIEQAARGLTLDHAALRAGVERDGVPSLALVAALRSAAGSAGQYVHFGATSQDMMDTATVLQLRGVVAHLRSGLSELLAELSRLALAHRTSVMAARTHGQQALPTSFGLKVLGWVAPLVRHQRRLSELEARCLCVQLGGAAGTLAALHPQGIALLEALARELALGVPSLPWHTQRDGLVELGSWASLLSGSLGKLAQDVILLAQSEVAELAEAEPGERGGSSSMPHKNNPMLSERILAAARANTALVGALHAALVQEHERGTHGWQLEWLTLAPLLCNTGGALANARLLAQRLLVFPARMRENLESGHGLALSEGAVGALSAHIPRPEAFALVKRASLRALAERRFLINVLREELLGAPGGLAAQAASIDWAALAQPENHLGHAHDLFDRGLAEVTALGITPAAAQARGD